MNASDTIVCVIAVIGFGLVIARALKDGEIRKRRVRIRRDEYPVYFYTAITLYAGACLLVVSLFSGLFMKVIKWSI